MKRAILLIVILCLAWGCATVPTPPARNANITESNLPSKNNLEGISVRQDAIPSGGKKLILPGYLTDGMRECYNIIFEFLGRPTYELSNKDIALDQINMALGFSRLTRPDSFAESNGFNIHKFRDENPSKSKVKYFLSQGYPVIAYLQSQGYQGYYSKPVVLSGYDDAKGIFTCSNPWSGKVEEIPYKEFNELNSPPGENAAWYNARVLYLKVPDSPQIPAPKQTESTSVRQTKTQPTPPKGVDTIEKPKTSTPVTPSSSTAQTCTVTWTLVKIRSGPGDDQRLVTVVRQGDKLTIIGQSGEWLKVQLEDGKQGWVSNRFVKY